VNVLRCWAGSARARELFAANSPPSFRFSWMRSALSAWAAANRLGQAMRAYSHAGCETPAACAAGRICRGDAPLLRKLLGLTKPAHPASVPEMSSTPSRPPARVKLRIRQQPAAAIMPVRFEASTSCAAPPVEGNERCHSSNCRLSGSRKRPDTSCWVGQTDLPSSITPGDRGPVHVQSVTA